MKIYNFSDFEKDNAWLMFRFDIGIAEDFLDVYMMMHLPSGFIMGHEIIEHEISQKHIDQLFKQCVKHGRMSSRVLLVKGDPSEPFLKQTAIAFSMQMEMIPSASLDILLSDIKRSYGSQFSTTSALGFQPEHANDDIDPEATKKFIPDSYDPCPCASGEKYKFCCKRIFHEIINAMIAAEDGDMIEAIKWIERAKERVGETAEVLCREAIVYSFFDKKKSGEILKKCLTLHQKHPRAHYIRAIDLTEQGDLDGALVAYKTAIMHYPETAYFHLNEAYNNLGTIYYELGDLANAKNAWEKALLYLPSDKVTQNNLRGLIYCKQDKIF